MSQEHVDEIPENVLAHAAEWKRQFQILPLSGDAKVLFAISLISRRDAMNWENVVFRLNQTIESIFNQTDGRWTAIICGQDIPDGLPLDERLLKLKHDRNYSTGKNDKYVKNRHIREHIKETDYSDGYFFVLDADDILAPDLVQSIMDLKNPAGYILDKGYMYDVELDELAPMQPPEAANGKGSPFYKHCGSCSAVRLDFRQSSDFGSILDSRGPHSKQLQYLSTFGMDLMPLPIFGCVYQVNHGDNFYPRRKSGDGKRKYVMRHKLPEKEKQRVLERFGLKPSFGN